MPSRTADVRLHIIAVGKLRDPPLAELMERYVKRCGWPCDVHEVQLRDRLDPARQRQEESRLLLQAVPTGAAVVTLDEQGQGLGSAALAGTLRQWQDEGERDVAFLIGGADGHGDAARQAARLVLALGPQTWPHELVRLMIAEQLYRAWTILANHPYHRA